MLSQIFFKCFFMVLIVFCLGSQALAQSPNPLFDENWQEGFHFPGIVGTVETTLGFDGKLIVGGTFTRAGLFPVTNITLLDLETLAYSSLGGGIARGVVAMTNYQGSLVVCEKPVTYPNPLPQNIWCWDGDQWSIMGEGLSPSINSLAVVGGELYAGKYHWNGTQWNEVFSPDGMILCQIAWNDMLIVGGNFNNVNGVPAANIAVWDGQVASPLGSGFNNPVADLLIQDNALVAGGNFTQSGALGVHKV